MSRIEKTVFISYRRTNAPWAVAIYQYLNQHGYDALIAFQGIASGDHERVILENIRARAHFLVLLTPSALERCGDPGDWLRREIETALEARRNIVPLMLDGFDFEAPSIGRQLTGKLAALKDYNALRVYAEYFAASMDRLRGNFLNLPLESVSHLASLSAPSRQAAEAQQAAAGAAPAVGQAELTAQTWFEKGFNAAGLDEKIRCYTEAIRLKPDDAEAYNNRGIAWRAKGDLDGALKDYAEALRLKPDYADAYNNRGLARHDKGDLDGALKDYAEAIRLRREVARSPAIAVKEKASPKPTNFAQESTAEDEYCLSYAWGDDTAEGKQRESVVDQLCAAAKRRGIKILRDKTALGLGERISKFMQRIGRGKRVFVVLSNKYLKSTYCMNELYEVWQNCRDNDAEFLSHVRVYTLPGTEVWTVLEQAKCAVFWREECGKIEALLKEHGYEILGEKGSQKYFLMKKFSNVLVDILTTMTDILQPRGFEEFLKYGFDDPPEELPPEA